MDITTAIGAGIFGLLLGVVVRLLIPRPGLGGCALAGLAGLVGAELGVLMAAAAGTALQWVGGIVVAVIFVAGACGLMALRRAPYQPHEEVPRTITDPDEKVRRARSRERES
jgi:hypothetical protein